MERGGTIIDVAGDPCAIIRRSTVGSALFFTSYIWLNHGQHGFWVSLSLGLVGCMIKGTQPAIRFCLLLALAPFVALTFF